MHRAPVAVRWSSLGPSRVLRPVTLDRLGKSEEFFEDVLASHPDLLGLQSRRSGIRGPFVVFRQASLPTPAGRIIFPDIVILTASGHVVVVEVKLSINPELRDRNVIAQIVDYASSFSMLDELGLLKVFDSNAAAEMTWVDLVMKLFPGEEDIEELAGLLRDRAARGEVNLVIACDRAPAGVEDVVAGIATQQTTGFDLDLVEVAPFVVDQGDHEELLFVPSTRLSTEIVARTAVTIAYRQGDARPDATIETTSLEELEQNKREATRAASAARVWPPVEVEEAFRREGDPIANQLLDFAKEQSAGGQFVSPAAKSNPTFGFYVAGRRPDGRIAKLMAFYLTLGWDDVWLPFPSALVRPETGHELNRRLKEVFGDNINLDQSTLSLKTTVIGTHLQSFEAIVLWFRDEAAAEAGLRIARR